MNNPEMSNSHITNGKATGSLVLGILSIVIPFIGLILGVVGIVFSSKAKKEIAITKETGEGLATAGFICSIVGLIAQVFAVIGLIGFMFISWEIMQM